MGDVMRLIKTVFVLGLGAFLLPSPPPGDPALQDASAVHEGADSAELALAAMRAASDVGGFCTRQPMVCDTAGRAFSGLKAKVKYSVRLLYEWSLEGDKPKGRPAQGQEISLPQLPPLPGLSTLPSASPARPAKDESRIPGKQARIDPLITGAITVAAADTGDDGGEGSENTLRIEDLTAPWNGPRAG